MLELNNVTKRFWRKEILHSVSVKLEGGIYGLLGANGAGKTTLLRCLAGLYDINDGQILWDGESIKNIKSDEVMIGYLPQKFEGIRELTVKECLEYFGDLKDIQKDTMEEEIQRVLEAVNLIDKQKEKIRKLSGGMLRRVGVAQALLEHPKLLLLDEPTVGLDPEERIRFKNVIAGLPRKEIVIISTHIVEDIETLCDKIIVMKDGKILGVFTAKEIEKKAEGRVWEISADQMDQIEGSYQIIREYRKDNKIVLRILAEQKQKFLEVRPTLEDGYLWMVSDIEERK